jgi:hypothetical protein
MWSEAFSLSRFFSQILHETIMYDIKLGVVKCLLKSGHTLSRDGISELILSCLDSDQENIFIGLISIIRSDIMSGNSDTTERNNKEAQKLNLEELIAEFGKEEFDDENDYEERK